MDIVYFNLIYTRNIFTTIDLFFKNSENNKYYYKSKK